MQNFTLNIIAETPQFIVVEKPASVNVEQLHDFLSVEKMVFDYLKKQKPQATPFVGVVHRLDRAVSGVMVFAKKKSVLKLLNEQFSERKVKKIYHAIVEKMPLQTGGELKHHLFVDKRLKKALIYDTAQKDTQECILRYRFLKKIEKGFLLEINLLTGKFHQIRAQLAAIGCPIVGDEKYGANTPFEPDAIALHASELHFFDTITNERLRFSSEKWHI